MTLLKLINAVSLFVFKNKMKYQQTSPPTSISSIANAVLVGKPVCYGLACGGAEGVAKVLTILKTEFDMAMALTGRASISEIDPSVIWR
jgi:hypothetical protein